MLMTLLNWGISLELLILTQIFLNDFKNRRFGKKDLDKSSHLRIFLSLFELAYFFIIRK